MFRFLDRVAQLSALLLLLVATEAQAIDAVDIAAQQIGKPYKSGAKGPDRFDCSGLTQYSYAQIGVSIPPSSVQQSQVGTLVTASPERGDLLFFDTNETITGVVTHVGIYEGNNTMINAMWFSCTDAPTIHDCRKSPLLAIDRVDITTSYWNPRFLFARRVSSVYDAAVNFSASANPNGPWSYGASAALGAITLFTTPSNPSQAGDHFVAGLDSWHNAPGIVEAYGAPLIVHNGSGGVVTDAGTGLSWQPGQLSCHPAPNGQFCVIRWTAPVAGNYSIDAVFTGADPHGTTTDVHVLKNGSEVSSGIINGHNQIAVGFGASFGVGGTLDFAVGWGSNGNYVYDTTFVDAAIVPIYCASSPACGASAGTFTITHTNLLEPNPTDPSQLVLGQSCSIPTVLNPISVNCCHANNLFCVAPYRPHFYRDISISSGQSTNTNLIVNSILPGAFTNPVLIEVEKIDRDDLTNSTNCPTGIASPCANGIGDAIDTGGSVPFPNPASFGGFALYFNGIFSNRTVTVNPGEPVRFNAYLGSAVNPNGRYIIYFKGTGGGKTFYSQLLLVVGSDTPGYIER